MMQELNKDEYLYQLINGRNSQNQEDLLSQVSHAYCPQSSPVQEGQGKQGGPGKAQIRPQTVRLRRTDKTYFPQEGQDHQEDHPASVVHRLQAPQSDHRGTRQERGANGDQGDQEEERREG